MGNYDPVPMNCGDCAFTTHYENELFEHLKAHLRKDANITVDNKEQRSDIIINLFIFITIIMVMIMIMKP